MKIYEYRVICPCSADQYKIGNIYMTAMRTEEESKQVKGEGIETIKNETFSNDKENGIYTYKILHFKSRVPAFMRWALPDKYCHCHEQSWNAHPHVQTKYAVPGMGDNLVMSVDSYYAPYKDGQPISDNLLNLTKEELAMRKVVYLDILDGKPKAEKKRDLSNWICPELNVNQKFSNYKKSKKDKKDNKQKKESSSESRPPEWTHNFDGEMMVAVKVVKIKFHWRGLQQIVEKFATTNLYHNLFLDNHRAMLRWADKWAKMNEDEVRELECQIYQKNNEQGFEKDDNKPDVEPPAEKPAGIPDKPDSSEENANY